MAALGLFSEEDMTMNKMKIVFAGVLALMMCAGISACGKDGDDAKDSSANAIKLNEEQQAVVDEAANKLPEMKLDNSTIKWMAHYDINPGDGNVTPPGLQMFKDTYDGKIDFVQTTWDNRYTDLAKYVMSNDSPDFFPASDMDGFPKGAIKGMFEPVDDYIDLSSDLWADVKATSDAFTFGGGHYVIPIKSSPNFVCVYNTKTIEDNGYEDPATLYYNNEWTWSKFAEMCLDFTDSENDLYALDGYWYGQALNDTCGVPLIGLVDGKVVNNMKDPGVTKVQNLMYELQKNNVVFDRSTNNWSTRGDGATGEGLGTYQTLFIPVGLWGIENSPENVKPFGDVEAGEIMFCPMPRLDDSDTHYVSARVDGYHMVSNAPNPMGVVAYMNCLKVCDTEASQVTEQQLRDDYKWNDEMIDMRNEVYRLVNEHPVYDFQHGVSSELETMMSAVNQYTMITGGGAGTWTTCVEENASAVDYIIKEVNENMESSAK